MGGNKQYQRERERERERRKVRGEKREWGSCEREGEREEKE